MRRSLAVLLLALASPGFALDAPPSSGAAVPIKRSQPKYPEAALRKRVQGCVVVSFVIDAQGRADQYKVEDSAPAGVFDQATLKALNGWRFAQPARPGRYAQAIYYQLSGQPPGPACKPAPEFEALNPPSAAAPGKREVRILSKVMPTVDASGGAGCVSVQFIIHPDGRVGEIAVIDAKPGTRYVAATIAALKQWRFESFDPPALKGQQTFNFESEKVRLPDEAVRAPFAVATADGTLKNEPCSGAKKG